MSLVLLTYSIKQHYKFSARRLQCQENCIFLLENYAENILILQKIKIWRYMDRRYLALVAMIVLMVVAALLLISLMLSPAILIALALFGLFLWALLYC